MKINTTRPAPVNEPALAEVVRDTPDDHEGPEAAQGDSDDGSAPEETPEELVRALLIGTHHQDRAERKRCTDALDLIEWEGASLLIAAAKTVALSRRETARELKGSALWVQETAKDAAARHAGWLRLQPGQLAGMIRAGLGHHELGTTVSRPVRGRLDSVVLEHLITDSLDYGDDFAEEAGQLLEEAAHSLRRPMVLEELAGY